MNAAGSVYGIIESLSVRHYIIAEPLANIKTILQKKSNGCPDRAGSLKSICRLMDLTATYFYSFSL
jgi:hypothetical protein